MRLLCEIAIIAVLIAFGWQKSFKERADKWRGAPPKPSVDSTDDRGPRTIVVATPTPSGSWMWDPAHRGTLDRPAYNSTEATVIYQDSGGQRYWIDAKGVRHYDGQR